MPVDVSKSDPAEGSREVIDRELKRQAGAEAIPAQINKRRKVRATRAERAAAPAKILRARGPRSAKPETPA
ncbi:MAG: hypothetical protein QM759_14795 [Terricaulis sp.]